MRAHNRTKIVKFSESTTGRGRFDGGDGGASLDRVDGGAALDRVDRGAALDRVDEARVS